MAWLQVSFRTWSHQSAVSERHMMRVELDSTDVTVVIGVLASLTSYFLTEEDPDVLTNVQRRFRNNLRKYGLIAADQGDEIVIATEAMVQRLRRALGE